MRRVYPICYNYKRRTCMHIVFRKLLCSREFAIYHTVICLTGYLLCKFNVRGIPDYSDTQIPFYTISYDDININPEASYSSFTFIQQVKGG